MKNLNHANNCVGGLDDHVEYRDGSYVALVRCACGDSRRYGESYPTFVPAQAAARAMLTGDEVVQPLLDVRRPTERKRPISTLPRDRVRGVYYDPRRDRWVARIRVNGRQVHVRSDGTKESAMRARDEALRQLEV